MTYRRSNATPFGWKPKPTGSSMQATTTQPLLATAALFAWPPSVIPELYMNRSLAHLHKKNLHKVLEDTSNAIDLFSGDSHRCAQSIIRKEHVKAHWRRGVAFFALDLPVESWWNMKQRWRFRTVRMRSFQNKETGWRLRLRERHQRKRWPCHLIIFRGWFVELCWKKVNFRLLFTIWLLTHRKTLRILVQLKWNRMCVLEGTHDATWFSGKYINREKVIERNCFRINLLMQP